MTGATIRAEHVGMVIERAPDHHDPLALVILLDVGLRFPYKRLGVKKKVD
jgi:hypothetical protein